MTERATECTKNSPVLFATCHPDAVLVDTEYDYSSAHDDYELYECPNCGLKFRVTLPN